MKRLDELTVEDLPHYVAHTYVSGGGSRPAVKVLRAQDGEAVLKDYGACDRWFATIIGPLLVWRETAALARLDGVRGIPRLIRRMGPRSFLMEHLRGVQPVRKVASAHNVEFIGRVSGVVERMHERGVAHGDLRRSSNILADAGGEPYLVDFVSCALRRSAWHPFGWIFPQLCRADRNAIIKLKGRLVPDALTEEERGRLTHTNPLDRLLRWFGARIRDLSRLLFVRR